MRWLYLYGCTVSSVSSYHLSSTLTFIFPHCVWCKILYTRSTRCIIHGSPYMMNMTRMHFLRTFNAVDFFFAAHKLLCATRCLIVGCLSLNVPESSSDNIVAPVSESSAECIISMHTCTGGATGEERGGSECHQFLFVVKNAFS